jgi:hypothetical protein
LPRTFLLFFVLDQVLRQALLDSFAFLAGLPLLGLAHVDQSLPIPALAAPIVPRICAYIASHCRAAGRAEPVFPRLESICCLLGTHAMTEQLLSEVKAVHGFTPSILRSLRLNTIPTYGH